jgi:hypothetical protein
MILAWRCFHAGDRVVYWDRRAKCLVRGEVVRPMLSASVVRLARGGHEVVIVNALLRRCPVALAYCRPAPAATPGDAA